MPIYNYECGNCKHLEEKEKRISDKHNLFCTKCRHEALHIVIQASPVIFKGAGWTGKKT